MAFFQHRFSKKARQDKMIETIQNNLSKHFVGTEDYKLVKEFENQMIDSYQSARTALDIDERISFLRASISCAQQIEAICDQSDLGKKYFSDMWMHCHNSQNPDFNFMQKIQLELAETLTNYDDIKVKLDADSRKKEKEEAFLSSAEHEIFECISNNPGLLQKDLYSRFDPDLKNVIGLTLSQMVKSGKVHKTKKGRTFELYITR